MIILHLSDIHFGRDNPKYNVRGEFNNKKKILQDLLISIRDNEMKPDHIVVTGDIAWFGKKNDFDEAIEWFKELLIVTKLSGSDITFCPGNHDVNRSYGNYKTDIKCDDIDAIDELYQYDFIHRMEAPLYNYEKFCEVLGVVPYHYPKVDKWESSYAIGYKDITSPNREVFRIISFNTALLSFIKDYPDDQMFIGLPQVMKLLNHNLISDNRDCYTIALFHHAERFLHTHEICEYDYRYATLPLLRRYVDLVLCGHTETGGIPVLYKQIGGAEMLTGGAAYYSDNHANAYSIVIVPDAQSDNIGRDVCLCPFTYSVEKGWHLNIRKKLPTGDRNIVANQPDFEYRKDFELVLSHDEKFLSIPMKSVSVFNLKNNIAMLSNSEDVCRNLDIVCSGPTDRPGTANVSISMAHRKENSIEALLNRENVFSFLNKASNAKNGSYFKINDVAGNVFLSGENISLSENVEGEGIEFLTKLRKIELNYDLIFQCPKDNAEYKKVDILSDLIEFNYTEGFKAFPELTTYSADKKQLLMMGLYSLMNRPLYILHKGSFRCQLYGNDFSLGEMSVLMGPYTTKGSGIIRKALSYATDDKRKITLRLCDNSICYVINDKSKVNINGLVKNSIECIIIDDMDCKWDFIYEAH